MRVFIAALVPYETKLVISKYIEQIKPIIKGVKWETEEKIHITLRFIGNLDQDLVDLISVRLGNVTHRFGEINVDMSNLGSFPNFKNPRVLVLNLKHNKLLMNLKNRIEDSLQSLGIDRDEKFFTPHITIGRVKKNFVRGKNHSFISDKSFVITKVGLFKSELTKKGSIHTPIKIFKL